MKTLENYIRENGVKFYYDYAATQVVRPDDIQTIYILCERLNGPGTIQVTAYSQETDSICLRVCPYNLIPFTMVLPSECLSMIETKEHKVHVIIGVRYESGADTIETDVNMSSCEAVKYYKDFPHIHGYDDGTGWKEEKGITRCVRIEC